MKFCSIASGSSGNCIFVGSDSANLLIDVGLSGKRIEFGLNEINHTTKDIDGILVTHEHLDHIKGLGVLARRYGIPIYTSRGTKEAILRGGNLGKFPEGIFHEIYKDETWDIKDLKICPFGVSHDAAEPVGFRIACGDKKAAVATDMGNFDEKTVEALEGLDVLLLEANHDINMLQVGPYPYYLKQRILGDRGHLSNEAAGRLLGNLLNDKIKKIFLGHLSHENNYDVLALETVKGEVTIGENPWNAKDFDISVAARDEVSQLIEF